MKQITTTPTSPTAPMFFNPLGAITEPPSVGVKSVHTGALTCAGEAPLSSRCHLLLTGTRQKLRPSETTVTTLSTQHIYEPHLGVHPRERPALIRHPPATLCPGTRGPER